MSTLKPESVEKLRRIDRLPPKQKEQLMRMRAQKLSKDRQIWYCKRGRSCDGEKHAGMPYKHARGDQWPPLGVDWDVWFYMSGRGAGKTMAGGHWTRTMAQKTDRIALIGRRGTDVRATMVEGPAGLIKACERLGETFDWKPALKEFTFENGAKAFGYSAEEPESLRGPEHGAGWLDEPCVAEGSLVLLERGLVPIEQVRVGDRAWTRQGWKRVTATFDNGVKETFWITAGSRRVRVTANHRMAVSDTQWMRCDQLSHGSTLVACSHMALQPGSNGADVAITATRRGTIATAGGGSSTGMSTRQRWGRSRRGTTSTTSTRTRRTTPRRISLRSPQLITTPSPSGLSLRAVSTSSRIRIRPNGRHAAARRWIGSGQSAPTAPTPASTAASNSRAERPTPRTAPRGTETVLVESVSPAGRIRVYDLTVEDAHEFVADGLVVHNCHMVLIEEVWSNFTLGLRSEGVPGGAKALLTSSPLPTKWTKARIAEKGAPILDEFGEQAIDEEGLPMFDPTTVLVSVPTSVNLGNLDEGYKRRVINPLRGTRKGKQELQAILLEDVEGALWDADWHQRKAFKRTEFDRVLIAVDPAGTNKKTSDATGIVVVGVVGHGDDAIFVVLADYTGQYTPDGWAQKTIESYEKWEADGVVVERYGGDSAQTILRNARYNGEKFKGKIIPVNATAGKKLRAEPIAALYEQKVVFHQQGADLAELEDEQLTWVPGVTKESPNRVDALVHGLQELSKKGGKATIGQATGSLGSPQNRAPGSAYRKKHWNR